MTDLATTVINQCAAELRVRRAALARQIGDNLHRGDDPELLSLARYQEVFDDRAEADAWSEGDLALVRHELAELKEVDAALKRIDDGRYGTCEECGGAIDARRLQAQPTAALCVQCQTERERAAIRRGAR